ncbi:MAG: DUF2516 family protein [Micrococcales bacterium]|nr:DUF2516 family protein [Micrococcales bacterium]
MTGAIQQGVAWVFMAVAVAAFVIELWAFLTAIRAPASAYLSAGKQSKTLWAVLTGFSALIGLSSLPVIGSGQRFGGLLTIGAVVVAAVFLASVRPAVATKRRRPPPNRSGGW